MITLLLLVRATCMNGVVLHAHPVRGESHIQRNTREVATVGCDSNPVPSRDWTTVDIKRGKETPSESISFTPGCASPDDKVPLKIAHLMKLSFQVARHSFRRGATDPNWPFVKHHCIEPCSCYRYMSFFMTLPQIRSTTCTSSAGIFLFHSLKESLWSGGSKFSL